jgi:hypothetical protein
MGSEKVVSTNAIDVSQKGLNKQKGGIGARRNARLGFESERVTRGREGESESVCV